MIPTDFSSVSKNALDYALELYKNTETIFDVIHIYHPSFDPVNPEIIDSSLGMESVKKENMAKLMSTISEDAKSFNIEVNSKVEISNDGATWHPIAQGVGSMDSSHKYTH